MRRSDWRLVLQGPNLQPQLCPLPDHDDGSDKLELYNLRADIGETKNLAAEKPEIAREWNALIAGFLKDTEAVVPVRNPNFKSGASEKAPAAAKNPLLGWKARGCTAEVKDGSLVVKGASTAPFLGFAPDKLPSGSKLRFRIQSSGGSGKITWLPGAKARPDAAKSTAFTLKAGAWAEVSADVSTQPDQTGILRLYLPAQDQPSPLPHHLPS